MKVCLALLEGESPNSLGTGARDQN